MIQCLKKVYHEFLALYYDIRYHMFQTNHQLPYIASIEETIDKLITEKKSISRFGDGEIRWILDLPQNSFQSQNSQMQKDLVKVLTIPNDNCLIGIPREIVTIEGKTKRARRFYREFFVENGFQILKYIDNNRKYYNSDISRCYMGYEDTDKAGQRFEKLKEIWTGKDIVIVEGEKTRLGVGNDLFTSCKTIKRILAPATNAYDKYNEIIEAIEKNIQKNELILLALGPTATILAYDLSVMGYQAIDIGHIDVEYEWFKLGTREKIPLKGKYVNEAGELGKQVLDVTDENYNNQIICYVR